MWSGGFLVCKVTSLYLPILGTLFLWNRSSQLSRTLGHRLGCDGVELGGDSFNPKDKAMALVCKFRGLV